MGQIHKVRPQDQKLYGQLMIRSWREVLGWSLAGSLCQYQVGALLVRLWALVAQSLLFWCYQYQSGLNLKRMSELLRSPLPVIKWAWWVMGNLLPWMCSGLETAVPAVPLGVDGMMKIAWFAAPVK